MSGILRQLALHQPVGVTRARVYETGKQWQPASTLAAVHPLNSRVSPLFPMETGQEMQGLVQTGFSAGSGAGPVSLETRLLRQQRPGDPQPSCSTSGKIAGVAHRPWRGDGVSPGNSPAIGKIAGFVHRPWRGGGDYPVISPAVGKIAATRTSIPLSLFFWRTPHGYT